eukprot:2446381-Prymnesium_polylepis.1
MCSPCSFARNARSDGERQPHAGVVVRQARAIEREHDPDAIGRRMPLGRQAALLRGLRRDDGVLDPPRDVGDLGAAVILVLLVDRR